MENAKSIKSQPKQHTTCLQKKYVQHYGDKNDKKMILYLLSFEMNVTFYCKRQRHENYDYSILNI